MKRFLLFGFDNYYPAGGWSDFIKDFDTDEDAVKYAKTDRRERDHYEVVDTETKESRIL